MHVAAPNCLQRLTAEGSVDAPYWWCTSCSRPAAFRAGTDGAALIDVWP